MQLYGNQMSLKRCIDRGLYDQWAEKSKLKLKEKILSNIENRIQMLVSTINNTIESKKTWEYMHSTIKSDHVPDGEHIQPFQISSLFIHNVTSNAYPIIEKWKGVQIEAMQYVPRTFREYHKKAGNYWNTHTAKWLGDFLFYPLLNTELNQYILRTVNIWSQNLKSGTKTTVPSEINIHFASDKEPYSEVQQIEDKVQETAELLKVLILKEIFNAKIKFDRTREQPLILDQSFTKSKLFKQSLIELGDKYGVKWEITPNINVEYRYIHTYYIL